jgi:hypothetical protein
VWRASLRAPERLRALACLIRGHATRLGVAPTIEDDSVRGARPKGVAFLLARLAEPELRLGMRDRLTKREAGRGRARQVRSRVIDLTVRTASREPPLE